MKKVIIVFGVSGFLGFEICKKLSLLNFKVIVVDIIFPNIIKNYIKKNIRKFEYFSFLEPLIRSEMDKNLLTSQQRPFGQY